MKILMVLSDNTYPPDIRIEKEAGALLKAGHEVYLLCGMRKDQKKTETVNGLKVHRINIQQSLGFGHLLFQIAAFFRVLFLTRNKSIQYIHVHDLPLAMPSILAGKISHKKVILDLHENYPEMMAMSSPNIVVSGLKKLELLACKHADEIIVVVEQAIVRLASLGIPEDKIYVISNYADTDRLDRIIKINKSLKKPALVYSGGLSPHRGMDTLLKAMAKINKEEDVYLYIVGGKEQELRRSGLKDLIIKLGLKDKVTMTGWISFDESIGYVKGGDVLLIPHHKNPHTEATIPHKIFQFMYLEKPILSSDVGPLKKVVNDTKSGLVFKAGDVDDLANKIIQILNAQEQWKAMGQNGRKAVIERYNWRMESKKLTALYEEMDDCA